MTVAGRVQAIIDWAQAGVISAEQARRLLTAPDVPCVVDRFVHHKVWSGVASTTAGIGMAEIKAGIRDPEQFSNRFGQHWLRLRDYSWRNGVMDIVEAEMTPR